MNEPKQDSLAPKDLKVSAFDLPPGVGESRLKSRRQLLSKLDNNSTSPYLGSRWDNMSETAATMITSEKCTKAFDLTREDPRLRSLLRHHDSRHFGPPSENH